MTFLHTLRRLSHLHLSRKVVFRMSSCTRDKESFSEVTEGKANVLLPPGVFYNPVQEFNRDLTVAVVRTFQSLHEDQWRTFSQKKRDRLNQEVRAVPMESEEAEYPGIVILEALAASGLRSMRFALEVLKVAKIIANDFDTTAAELIAKNAERNGEVTKRLVSASCDDANLLMIRSKTGGDLFDVIDLDPYGSAAKFLSAAMYSISHGGLLCVTCTDAAVLCGSAFGTALGRYGGTSLRCSSSHEVGLRLLLHSLQLHAAMHGRYIQPLISLSVDFYLRVFVRVFRGPGEVTKAPCRTALVYVCSGCGNFHLQPLGRLDERREGVQQPGRGPPVGPTCSECGSHFNVAGPIWSDPIHDVAFVESVLTEVRPQNGSEAKPSGEEEEEEEEEEEKEQKHEEKESSLCLKTTDRIVGMLSLVAEELSDCPLFYRPDHMTKVVHCHVPRAIQFRSAILNAGFRVSNSHVCPGGLKTDAPPSLLWDILRCWVKHHRPVAERRLQESDSIALRILNKEVEKEVNFEEHPLANPDSRKQGLLRYQPNPERDWGPKAKAKRGVSPSETLVEKRARMQGRREKLALTEEKDERDDVSEDAMGP